MKSLNKAVLFAFAFSAASGVAFAGGDKAESGAGGAAGATGGDASISAPSPSFSAVDKDNSGYVDASEAAELPTMDMQLADTNGDGRLSRVEYEAAMMQGGPPSGVGGAGPGGAGPGSGGSN